MGQKQLGSRGFPGPQVRCKPAVFWQTGRQKGVFSTRNKKVGFAGFFPGAGENPGETGARIGLISLDLSIRGKVGKYPSSPAQKSITIHVHPNQSLVHNTNSGRIISSDFRTFVPVHNPDSARRCRAAMGTYGMTARE